MTTATILSIDRHHEDLSEEALLYTTLGAEKDCFKGIRGLLSREDFTKPESKILFDRYCKMLDCGVDTNDFALVIETLRENGELEKVGGQDFLADMADRYYLTACMSQHVQRVTQARARRDMSQVFTQAHNEMGMGIPTDEILEGVKHGLSEIDLSSDELVAISIKDTLNETVRQLEDQMNGDVLPGIQAGFVDVDQMTGGFKPGELIIIAGRPGMGKTVFVNDIAINSGANVLYFTLEMSRHELLKRKLSSLGKVGYSRMRTGILDNSDWQAVVAGANKAADLSIWYVDKPSLSIGEIELQAEKEHKEKRIELVIIDYLQLIRPTQRMEVREREVSDISRRLKVMARQLQIPVICVAQLNRQCEGRKDKKPMLSDLRESGSVEQDADFVIFLFRNYVYSKDLYEKNNAELLIEKSRNSETGAVKLFFNGDQQTFKNWSGDQG